MTFKRLRAEQWGEGGGLDQLRGWQWGANEPEPEPDPAAALVALPNLIGAWDADRDASITTETGVSALASTYTAVPFVQTSGTAQPVRTTGGPYGRRFLSFDGVNDWMATAGDQGWTGGPFTWAFTCKDPTNMLVTPAHNRSGPTGRSAHYCDREAGPTVRLFGGSANVSRAFTPANWNVIVIRSDGANSAVYVNGVATTGNPGTGWANIAAPHKAELVVAAAPGTAPAVTDISALKLGELWAWKAGVADITDEDITDIIIPYLTGRWIE